MFWYIKTKRQQLLEFKRFPNHSVPITVPEVRLLQTSFTEWRFITCGQFSIAWVNLKDNLNYELEIKWKEAISA
jgi:hypothetical protein